MSHRKIRALLCKGGMDGHTRPLYILAQEFRNAGLEVILTGAYQSAREVSVQAIQEDPDIIAISIHTRGHLKFFSVLSGILLEETSPDDFAIAAGGVIPPSDYPALNQMGVNYISSPGDAMQNIIFNLVNISKVVRKESNCAKICERLKAGDKRALAQILTLIERGESVQFPTTSQSDKATPVIGLSGAGGAGKSSLLGKLIELLRKSNKLGVLCVDPVSASGGAVLADRIRFQTYDLTTDPNVFIRSSAARKPWRGVSRTTALMLKAMKRAKMDFIFLESVGEGQGDSGFRKLVDTFVYVAHPDMGDAMQMLKGGLIETADIIALNKADKINAVQTRSLLLENFSRSARKDGWTVPVIETVASDEKDRETGIKELWGAIMKHQEFLKGGKRAKR